MPESCYVKHSCSLFCCCCKRKFAPELLGGRDPLTAAQFRVFVIMAFPTI